MATKKKSPSKGSQKTFAAKRTMNDTGGGGHQANTGARKGFQNQDPKRRLGGFEGAGEHARTGNPGHS
jgi:hypothetical protein